MTKTATRLYKQFQPEHYELELMVNNQTLTFSGKVTITGRKVGRPAQRLTFHQKDLTIGKAAIYKLDKTGEQPITVSRINRHQKYNEVRLHTGQSLTAGAYRVEMEFDGRITKTMQGIYPSEFRHDGLTKRLIGTQFESHHAREAFPCIDEPEAKATFRLTLDTEAGLTVLSNTPIDSQQQRGERQVTVFEPTPRMSTYLLAFVYGEMHCVESATARGTQVRSWASLAQDASHLEYSVHEAVRLLEFYEAYFGVPYPLAKCDQVALPDFDAGAMENWGLVTYREIALLADPVNRSVSNEQYVSLVVAHELSHQWFGNLVTMQWWDDLWLNESFASLMEHLSLDAIHPDWQQWELYTASDVISTTSRDIYKDIQPVGVTVTDPDLIETLFDPGIVYAKGGRLLKMLRDYIGDEAFAAGLRRYFQKFAYANATRQDLWQELSRAAGRDLVSLMAAWISQPGMPLVEVSQHGHDIRLRQSRLMLDAEPDNSVWPVPLLASAPVYPDLFDKPEMTARAAGEEFIIVNHQASGHYFTSYTEADHRQALNQQLQNRQLPPAARINILNDAYMLSRKGVRPLTDALDTITGCQAEDRDAVWAGISRIVGAVSQMVEGDKPAEKLLRQLRRHLAEQQYRQLGWDDQPTDDPNTKQLRHTLVAYMLLAEDQSAIDEALRRYHASGQPSDLPAELRATILAAAVKHGPVEIVDRLIEFYPATTADIQLDITAALGSTRDAAQAAKILKRCLGPKGIVRDQDVMRWVVQFIRNQYTRATAWQWLIDNWPWLESAIGESKSFDYLPVYCAGNLTTTEWQMRYQDFFGPKQDDKRLAKNIAIGLNDIAARVAWRQREADGIKQWLVQHQSSL